MSTLAEFGELARQGIAVQYIMDGVAIEILSGTCEPIVDLREPVKIEAVLDGTQYRQLQECTQGDTMLKLVPGASTAPGPTLKGCFRIEQLQSKPGVSSSSAYAVAVVLTPVGSMELETAPAAPT